MRVLLAVLPLAVAASLLTGPVLVAGPLGQAAATTSTVTSPPTGAGVLGYMDTYVMTHPYRVGSASFVPQMAKARDDLVTTLQGFGLTVQRHNYTWEGQSGQNILAFQTGATKPNEWIVLSAHYDTVETTVFGAWDDGAGVAQLLELARGYSTGTFNRTIVYAFFDDEEQCLCGSAAFVDANRLKIHANLNFDPPGLNWPCTDPDGKPLPVKASFDEAKTSANVAGYQRIKNAVISGLNAAGVPANARDLAEDLPIASVFGAGLAGTSDHESFNDKNIPNAFLGSLPSTKVNANTRVLNYPLHTPGDDLAAMIARCNNSRATLEDAFDVQIVITNKVVDILNGP